MPMAKARAHKFKHTAVLSISSIHTITPSLAAGNNNSRKGTSPKPPEAMDPEPHRSS